MANPNISVSPAPDAVGVALGSDISIIFDTEIDVGSLLAGNIVITGIEDQLWSGPDLMMFVDVSKNAYDPPLLSVPTLTGPIDFAIDIKRVDSNLNEIQIVDDGTDPNSGDLYWTKVVLRPTQVLNPNIKYGVIISTDITLNTVFDAIYNSDPNSSGKIVATGPYLGTTSDTFIIEITGGSSYLDLQFQWYKQSSPTQITQVNSANKREVYLSDGVTIYFDKGSFTVGDKISFNVIPQNNLDNIVSWSFTTGSGSIVEPSSQEVTTITNVNITDNIVSTYNVEVPNNTFIGSFPAHMSYQVDPALTEIKFVFEKDIDIGTLDSSKITIVADDVIPDIFDNAISANINIDNIIVNGSELTLVVSQLSGHTIYTVTIDSTAFKFVDQTYVNKSELVFLTRFDNFYTTPTYILAKAGAATTDVPEILLAEQIGIQSSYIRSIFGKCINRINSLPLDLRNYITTVVRDYTTNMVLKTVLENSSKLTSVSKGIDTFKIFFGGGQFKPLYKAIMDEINKMKPVLATCGKLGIGQRAAPVPFEKSISSPTPFVRQRTSYVRGTVPGLNDEYQINTRFRTRYWRSTRKY